MSSGRDAGGFIDAVVNQEFQRLNAKAQSNARRAINVMRNAVLEVLGRDGHGRVYGRHTASAPGESPAPDTGNLRRNWRQLILANQTGRGVEITCRLKSDVPYADILEEGGRRMARRPYKDKVKAASLPKIDAMFRDL